MRRQPFEDIAMTAISVDESQGRISMKDVLDSRSALWIAQALLGLLMSVGAYVMKTNLDRVSALESKIQDFAEWKAETSSNRFTNADALEVWRAIADVKERMASAPNTPPQWFIDRVTRLEDQIDNLNTKIDALAKRP